MENFQTPYDALSIGEFWRRWHMSLSTWFKDYLYIPLGGNRVNEPRRWLNLLITFGVSGLWHGANWTYVCWGLLNGVYLVAGSASKKWRDRCFSSVGLYPGTPVRKAVMWATTFLLTCLAWIVFRAHTLADAGYVVAHLTRDWNFDAIKTLHFPLRQLPVAIGSILALEVGQRWQRSGRLERFIRTLPLPVRWAAYAAFVCGVLILGVYRGTEFIYFQF